MVLDQIEINNRPIAVHGYWVVNNYVMGNRTEFVTTGQHSTIGRYSILCMLLLAINLQPVVKTTNN